MSEPSDRGVELVTPRRDATGRRVVAWYIMLAFGPPHVSWPVTRGVDPDCAASQLTCC
ncbi:MAG: hypothetical protein IT361_16475 [Gemmatimonadaceae bacterium]|nr:hypothetical protein [Gemmatimonadaceae bacterium]